jgi:hypothetical protein
MIEVGIGQQVAWPLDCLVMVVMVIMVKGGGSVISLLLFINISTRFVSLRVKDSYNI